MTFTNFSHHPFTDTCPGMESNLEGDMFQCKWEPQEQQLHIKLLEMRAVAKALLGFSRRHSSIVLGQFHHSLLYKQAGGMGSLSLWKEMELLFQLVINWGSPCRHSTFWEDECCCRPAFPPRPHQEITRHLFCTWGSPHMHLSATRWNIKLLTLVSPVLDH